MSSLRQVGLGILTAIFSIALLFGSVLLAFTEGGVHLAMLPTPSETTAPLVATPRPGEATFTPTSSPAPTETPTQPSSHCKDTPPGWQSWEVQPGDTLAAIAEANGTTVELLRQANCLTLDTLIAGILLSVPPSTPTSTPTPTRTLTATAVKQNKTNKQATRSTSRCSGHPAGWVAYKVKRGDTIFSIASSYGLSSTELMSANCLTSDLIRVGQVIYVPNYPSKTPKRTSTPRPSTEIPPISTEPSPATTESPPIPVTTEPSPPNPQPPPTEAQPPAETTEPAPVASEAPSPYP